jgi:hypothetical protein
MSLPKVIADLIGRFEQHLDSYKSGQYNETQLRRYVCSPITETNKQIDQLVYELYDLAP